MCVKGSLTKYNIELHVFLQKKNNFSIINFLNINRLLVKDSILIETLKMMILIASIVSQEKRNCLTMKEKNHAKKKDLQRRKKTKRTRRKNKKRTKAKNFQKMKTNLWMKHLSKFRKKLKKNLRKKFPWQFSCKIVKSMTKIDSI